MAAILKLLAPLIPILLGVITPALRDMLGAFALDFYAKAKTTSNPWDDVAAALLLGILQVPNPT